MKNSEKAALVINLSRKQMDRAIRSVCELAGESNACIADKAWDELVKEPVVVNWHEVVTQFDGYDRNIVMASIAYSAFQKLNKKDEKIEDDSDLHNARIILEKALEIVNNKISCKD